MRSRSNFYFILPALFMVGVFYVLPLLLNFYYSFTDWNTYNPEINFIGLQNFKDLFEEKFIWKSLWITIKYAFLVLLIENILALVLALSLEKGTLADGLLRSIFFIPVLISSLAAGYLFKGIFDPNGPLNSFLSIFVSGTFQYPWLGKLNLSLFLVAFVHSWKWMGVPLIVYIAALNSIPYELVESAMCEGAGRFKMIRLIKLPMIGPAFTFNITLTFIGALSVFDIVMSMTRGGPARSTEVLNMFIFTKYGTGNFGYATAISLMLFFVILVAAVFIITSLRKREVEL